MSISIRDVILFPTQKKARAIMAQLIDNNLNKGRDIVVTTNDTLGTRLSNLVFMMTEREGVELTEDEAERLIDFESRLLELESATSRFLNAEEALPDVVKKWFEDNMDEVSFNALQLVIDGSMALYSLLTDPDNEENQTTVFSVNIDEEEDLE